MCAFLSIFYSYLYIPKSECVCVFCLSGFIYTHIYNISIKNTHTLEKKNKKSLCYWSMCLLGFSQTEKGLVPVPQRGLSNIVKYHKKPLMLLVLNCALGALQE